MNTMIIATSKAITVIIPGISQTEIRSGESCGLVVKGLLPKKI